jgi:Primase C terminal 2 (PriCT-2)
VWTNSQTGEVEDKLHLHWRLATPTKTPDEHAKLKEARALASAIAGADPSGVPINHPIRWPGSWHRKGRPKLCKIVDLNTEIEIEDLDAAIAALGTTVPRNNGNSKPNASFFRDQADPEKVRDALRYYPNNDLEYDEWLAIGMAIHDYLGEAGRALFDEWSQKSSKFNEKNQDTKWRSFKPGGGITIGTLFELAKRGGWRGNGFRRSENTEARQDKTLSPDDF